MRQVPETSPQDSRASAGAAVEAPALGVRAPGADDADTAMDALRRLVQALRSMGLRTERDFGVTAAQLFVLRQIAAHPGLSLAELARRTLTRESSVSEVVTRLVTGGFVERRIAAPDRRRVELRLARAGEDVMIVAPETVQERLVDSFRRLPDEARRALSRGLTEWLAATGLEDASVSMFFEPAPDEPRR